MTIKALLIISATIFCQSVFSHNQENDNLQQNQDYNKALYSYLRNHNDLKIQLIGYSIYLKDEEKDIKAIKKVLAKSIVPESDKHILFLADNLCHSNEKLEKWCHKKEIHKIHQQVDPENIMTYVNALHDEEDEQYIFDWMNLTAEESTYSNSFLFELSLILSKQIAFFNDENPSLLFLNESDKSEILSLVKELRLIEKGLLNKDFLDTANEASYIMTSISIVSMSIMMAQPVSLRNFTRYCELQDYFSHCYNIASILQSDKTFMNEIIGDSIKNKIETGEENKNIINKSYQMTSCLHQSTDMTFAWITNFEFNKQYLTDAIEFGEAQAIKNLAYKVYDTVKANGFNPEFNPKDCESS